MPIGSVRTGILGGIDAIPDSVVSRPADDGPGDTSGERGVVVNPNTFWPAIGAKISAYSSGFTTAYLEDLSDNTVLETVDISGLSATDTFTFDNVNLSAGTDYAIYIDAEGSSWTAGFKPESEDYTDSSPDLDLVGAWQGSVGGSYRAIVEIGNVGFD